LSTNSTTNDADGHVVGITEFEYAQGGFHGCHRCLARAKIGTGGFAVDGNAAITIGEQAHAGHSRLAPSHTIIVFTFGSVGQGRFSFTLLQQPEQAASIMPVDRSWVPAGDPDVVDRGLRGLWGA